MLNTNLHNVGLNILDIDLPSQENDICIICTEPLSQYQTYKLPECGHTFHTHCIVTWFRHSPSVDDEKWKTDGKCPLCGNKGINNITIDSYNYFRNLNYSEKIKYKIIKNEARKKTAPKLLLKFIQEEKKI